MKILLATSDLDEVMWAADLGLADGIVTSPSLLHAEIGERAETLAALARESGLTVYAPVGAMNATAIYRDGRELARISEDIVVQVPFVEDAIGAIRRLSADGVPVAATLVFNAAQALLAAKVGAVAVSVSVPDLVAHGQAAAAVLADIHQVFRRGAVECDLIAALPDSSVQFTDCASAGADAVVVLPTVLRGLLVHPLTDRGVDALLSGMSRRPRLQLGPQVAQ